MAEIPPPLRVREADAVPNVIPVYEMSFSGATITRLGPTGVQILVDSGGGGGAPTGSQYLTLAFDASLTAERVLAATTGLAINDLGANNTAWIYLVTPVSASSGGTGQSSIGAGRLVAGSAGNAANLAIIATGAVGQVLGWSTTQPGSMLWVNTASGAGATKTIRIPLALATVQPDSSNAFFFTTTGTTVDFGAVAYADSGEGIATYWGIVPTNLASTPAWALDYYHIANASGGGNVIASCRGRIISHGTELDGSYTTLSSAASYTTFIARSMAIQAVSGGNFDSVLALVQTAYLLIEVNRHGGNASDTLGGQWNLHAVNMRVDVT